jgi:hypothetical protein
LNESPPKDGTTYRVRFLAEASPGAAVLAEFTELRRVALVESVALDIDDVEDPASGLRVLHLPGGSDSSPLAHRGAQTWLGEGGAVVDLVLQSDRILWRPGRAVVIGGARDFEIYLRALASFSCYEGELRRLEAAVVAWWPIADADSALTHQVDRRDLRRWAHVNERTEAVTRARLARLAIEGALEQGPEGLPGLARRLFIELALRLEATHRLERLGDKLEALYDLYELANDRLSEFSYFSREYLLEWLIVAVLAFEAALLLYDLL